MDFAQIDTWPNAQFSRQIIGPVHRWHVQETGSGKTVLMLHGAGGSTHSFRDLLPLLAQKYHVIALDLPGQGFTQLGARHRCGLDAMAEDIAALCVQEGWTPEAIVGHSAGGAIALRLAEDDVRVTDLPPQVIGLNAALAHFKGLAGLVFPVMAKALATVPFTASLFSGASANPDRIRALIQSTGSELNAEGLELYRRLVADKKHVNGTLLMMSQWRLHTLRNRLSVHPSEVHFIVGDQDTTVPPSASHHAARRLERSALYAISDSGHLVHEERPQEVAKLIADIIVSGALVTRVRRNSRASTR